MPFPEQATRDAQFRRRIVQEEIDREAQLLRGSPVRMAAFWVTWVGLAVFAAGWIPIQGSRSSVPPDARAAYLEMLDLARAASKPDGSIPVMISHGPQEMRMDIPSVDVVTAGTEEEGRIMVEAVGLLTTQERVDLAVSASHGWVLKSIAPESALAKEGFKVGDVITRVGATELPPIEGSVQTAAGYPLGYTPLRIIGALAALCGFGVHRLRSARLRRLLRTRAEVERDLDSTLRAMGGSE